MLQRQPRDDKKNDDDDDNDDDGEDDFLRRRCLSADPDVDLFSPQSDFWQKQNKAFQPSLCPPPPAHLGPDPVAGPVEKQWIVLF